MRTQGSARAKTRVVVSARAAFFAAFVSTGDAQLQTRRATNLAAVLAYPGYYHGRPVLIVGKVAIDKDQFRV